jgi:hypothetical protein
VLISSFLLAFIVAITRIFAIFVGSVIGGFMAKAPKKHNMLMWLSLVTQAGVSLGKITDTPATQRSLRTCWRNQLFVFLGYRMCHNNGCCYINQPNCWSSYV